MTPDAPQSPSRPPRRSLSWLPAVIALPVTAACAILAAVHLLVAPLTDSGPYPHTGWIALGLIAEIVLGLAALALVVLSQVKRTGQHVIAILGCAVIAAAVLSFVISTMLSAPS